MKKKKMKLKIGTKGLMKMVELEDKHLSKNGGPLAMNPHEGTSFDSFLKEENIDKEVSDRVKKRIKK